VSRSFETGALWVGHLKAVHCGYVTRDGCIVDKSCKIGKPSLITWLTRKHVRCNSVNWIWFHMHRLSNWRQLESVLCFSVVTTVAIDDDDIHRRGVTCICHNIDVSVATGRGPTNWDQRLQHSQHHTHGGHRPHTEWGRHRATQGEAKCKDASTFRCVTAGFLVRVASENFQRTCWTYVFAHLENVVFLLIN